jgi:hypothetical protein
VSISDDAGPGAGCTIALERTPVQDEGQGLAVGKLGRCATEKPDHGPRHAAVVVVTNGRLDGSTELAEVFGTWERIFYGELDGRRRKRVLVKIIGE